MAKKGIILWCMFINYSTLFDNGIKYELAGWKRVLKIEYSPAEQLGQNRNRILKYFSLFIRGPRWVRIMKKTGGRKSRDTLPLTTVKARANANLELWSWDQLYSVGKVYFASRMTAEPLLSWEKFTLHPGWRLNHSYPWKSLRCIPDDAWTTPILGKAYVASWMTAGPLLSWEKLTLHPGWRLDHSYPG